MQLLQVVVIDQFLETGNLNVFGLHQPYKLIGKCLCHLQLDTLHLSEFREYSLINLYLEALTILALVGGPLNHQHHFL